MRRYALRDDQWDRIKDFLPGREGHVGGTAADNRILRLDRLRLGGLSGVKDEVLLTATAQNLKRLVKLLGRAPPPLVAACLA
jgi:hypothetical protein